MRLSPWWLIALVVTTTTLVAVVVLHSVTPAESAACEDATSSSEHGLIAQAEKQYAAILAEDPDDECALTGLKTVARKLCDFADRLSTLKEPEQAEKAYFALLAKYPWRTSEMCAREGLIEVRRQLKEKEKEKEKEKQEQEKEGSAGKPSGAPASKGAQS